MSSARLTYQHYMLLARQGYLLHPDIVGALGLSEPAESDQSPLEVLDIATGNGIWLTELADDLSRKTKRQINYTGLDVSPDSFPRESSWSSNMRFATYNIFSDVAEEHIGRYDVVHLRFIVAILWQDQNRKTVVLNNLKRLLKPGGWLQWQDGPAPTIAEYKVNNDGTCTFETQLHPLRAEMDKLTGTQSGVMWMNQLDEFVEKSGGFDHVKAHWVPMRLDRAKYENDLSIWTTQEALQAIEVMTKGRSGSEKAVQDFRDTVDGMSNGTIQSALRSVVVIGQKPAS